MYSESTVTLANLREKPFKAKFQQQTAKRESVFEKLNVEQNTENHPQLTDECGRCRNTIHMRSRRESLCLGYVNNATYSNGRVPRAFAAHRMACVQA